MDSAESFAQTGAQQDDLFDDVEYTNGEESMQTRAPDDLFDDDFTPISEPVVAAPPPVAAERGRVRDRGRGRGRGSGRGGLQPAAETAAPSRPKDVQSVQDEQLPAETPTSLLNSQHAPPPPAEAKQPRTQAVRGNRLATGGNQRTKLTEEELAEKMNRISLKNASLEAAFARSQADAESFAQRENQATKRRQEERRDRQQMMGEREKNRLRKMKAQEGREWDSEKREEDFAGRGGRGYGRGAHGGVTGPRQSGASSLGGDGSADYTDGREYMYREDRGRGGRVRGGRGRGRGGHGEQQDQRQSAPRATDFPDLPLAPAKVAKEGTQGGAPALSFPAKAKSAGTDQTNGSEQSKSVTGGVPPDEATNSQRWADMVEE